MSDDKKQKGFWDFLAGVVTKENMDSILGQKKNGIQRAPYDVYKEHVLKSKKKKKKRKGRKDPGNSHSLYLSIKKNKKGKRKKNKYWRL